MPDTEANLLPLTDNERERFEELEGVMSGEYSGHHALMRVEFDGKPAAAVVYVEEVGEEYNIYPLALLLTQELVDRIVPPEGGDTQ